MPLEDKKNMKMKRKEKKQRKRSASELEKKKKEKKAQDELKKKNKEIKRKTDIRTSTRQKKKRVMENVQEVCGICGGEWEEIWLDCGLCGDWFHADCVGASMDELGEVNYTCDFCTK